MQNNNSLFIFDRVVVRKETLAMRNEDARLGARNDKNVDIEIMDRFINSEAFFKI